MAASVFVSDERVLNVSIGVAELRLANLVQGDWLSGASQAAYQDGIDHLVRAGPFGDLPGASRLVRVQFVDPVYPDGAMTLGVRWEAVGVTGGLFPVLDANIRLSGEGGQSSRAVLTASYGLRSGRAQGWTGCSCTGWPPRPSRRFMTSVAGALEGTREAAGEAAASSWWDPGPEPAPG
jgi:hypothetical protein